jgi:opacity protein-like surface antigen
MFRTMPVKATVAAVFTMFLVLGSATTARAQGFISPFIGFNFGGDSGCPEITGCEDKTLNLGVGVGTLGNVFGFELEFGYAKNFFGQADNLEASVFTMMGNAMLAPKLGPVRPYALAGLGLMKSHAQLTTSSLFENTNNQFGWDVGGGLMGFFGEHVGVRGDIRYFHAFQELPFLGFDLSDQKLDFGRASAALVFKF